MSGENSKIEIDFSCYERKKKQCLAGLFFYGNLIESAETSEVMMNPQSTIYITNRFYVWGYEDVKFL